MRPLTAPQREALDRMLARQFPRQDSREVVGNLMLVGLCLMVAALIVGVLMWAGPQR